MIMMQIKPIRLKNAKREKFKDLLMNSLVRRHHYHFLSLRLVRNPSGFSERFPTSGNDIYVALLIAVLVNNIESSDK